MCHLPCILKPGEETHSYEPTPQDIIAIQNADLFIYVGGENDEWVEDILESPEMEDVKRLRLVDCVGNILAEEHVEGMKEESGHSHEDEEEESHDEEEHFLHSAEETEEEHNEHVHTMDEHVWTSPCNAIDIVEHITEELCSLDPEHGQTYKDNAEAYETQLKELGYIVSQCSGKCEELYTFVWRPFPVSIFCGRVWTGLLCGIFGLCIRYRTKCGNDGISD